MLGLFEYGRNIQVILLKELVTNVLWQLFFYAVAYELAAKMRSAAFVAKYITH